MDEILQELTEDEKLLVCRISNLNEGGMGGPERHPMIHFEIDPIFRGGPKHKLVVHPLSEHTRSIIYDEALVIFQGGWYFAVTRKVNSFFKGNRKG